MATLGNVSKNVVIHRDPVTYIEFIVIIESCCAVGILIALVGVVSNIINIRTFIAMGLSDGVTVSFLSLAIFDLTYLIASLCLSVSGTFYITELTSNVYFEIEPFGVFIFFGGIMILINVTNVLTTTYVAVARCMCVARPLQFKNTFTKRRAVMFMIGFSIFAIGIYTPILTNMGMVDKFDKIRNTSRPSLWVSASRETVKEAVWMVTDMFLPVVTQFIILVCVVMMARSLRAASRFRQTSVSVSEKVSEPQNGKGVTFENDCSPDGTHNVTDKLTGKELRVVQQVVLISVIYIICNIPKIMISVVTTVVPEFTIGKSYTKIYLCVNGVRKHFDVFNASVNLLVYYKYNTKFRTFLLK